MYPVSSGRNGILGYAQLLQGEPKLAPYHDWVETIIQSGEHLLLLINDLLDLAKIEAGKIELAEEPLDLAIFLADIASMVRLWAEQKGLDFHWRLTPDRTLLAVRADTRRLRQVLLNLLGNAVKFTDTGTVTLYVNAIPLDEPGVWSVHFQVEDSGMGIAENDLPAICAPFQQAV